MVCVACLALSLAGLQTSSTQTVQGDFNSKGVKIHYARAGEGEPVVLIHGWMSDSTMWGRSPDGSPKLTPQPGFQVIAIDCRGHGTSDKPHEPAQYGPEMAEDVVRLMDHLKIKKAHLIGYSMGAFIAGKVAALHPDRVISLVFGGQAPLLIDRATSRSAEVEVFARAVDEGKGLGPYILEVMPKNGPKLTLEQANAYAEALYKGRDVKAWAVAGLSLGKLEVRPEDLKKCAAPMLFIHGSKDESAVAASAYVRGVIGKGEVKAIEGANHISTLGNPEFGKSVVEFLLAHKNKGPSANLRLPYTFLYENERDQFYIWHRPGYSGGYYPEQRIGAGRRRGATGPEGAHDRGVP